MFSEDYFHPFLCSWDGESQLYVNKCPTRCNYTLFILSVNCSTCFGWFLQHTQHTQIGLNSPTTATGSNNGWLVPDAVDTVICVPDDGWRNHPKHVQQFTDKLCIVACCWAFSDILSAFSFYEPRKGSYVLCWAQSVSRISLRRAQNCQPARGARLSLADPAWSQNRYVLFSINSIKFMSLLMTNLTHNSFLYFYLFQFSTCFEQTSSHHQESQLYQYHLWYMSPYVGGRVVCRFRWKPASFIIPDSRIILIQFCSEFRVLVCLFCIAEFYVLLAVHLITICYNLNLHTTRSPTCSDIYQRWYWYNSLSWCST